MAFYALHAGEGVLATVSVFEDRASAEESINMAADCIRRQNLASLLPNPPEIIAGEVRAHELNLTNQTRCARGKRVSKTKGGRGAFASSLPLGFRERYLAERQV